MKKNDIIEQELEKYPAILVAKDVAEILRVGKVKSYELLNTGEIKSFRLGKKNIRTTKKDLLEYLSAKEVI